MGTTNKQNVEPMVKNLNLQIGFSKSVSDEDKRLIIAEYKDKILGGFVSRLNNLTVEELNVAKSNPTHEWCYRVWVKSFYEGEDADRVEEKFGMYERVFTKKSDVDEYKKKVEYDLEVLGYHPFESAYKFYDCAVMYSTLLLNWNNVRIW